MGATYMVRGTWECTTSWKNAQIRIDRSTMHRKKMNSQYAANVCTVLAPGMDYILRHDAADIQVPYPVGIKNKRDK